MIVLCANASENWVIASSRRTILQEKPCFTYKTELVLSVNYLPNVSAWQRALCKCILQKMSVLIPSSPDHLLLAALGNVTWTESTDPQRMAAWCLGGFFGHVLWGGGRNLASFCISAKIKHPDSLQDNQRRVFSGNHAFYTRNYFDGGKIRMYFWKKWNIILGKS